MSSNPLPFEELTGQYELDREKLRELAGFLNKHSSDGLEKMLELGMIRIGQDAGPLDLYVPTSFMDRSVHLIPMREVEKLRGQLADQTRERATGEILVSQLEHQLDVLARVARTVMHLHETKINQLDPDTKRELKAALEGIPLPSQKQL